MRGCEENAPFASWTDLRNVPQFRCPRRPILEDPAQFNVIINYYNGYKNGFLPSTGGLDDQSAIFLDVMSVVGDTIDKCAEANRSGKSNASGTSLLGN